ncbi:hypothetical protein [Kingella bonacorsii]|uniref:Uncharacterized protein n=1 Tax=Kingella bonacorsii TaxID=2796361 RepID=A0ABS1BP60_9NEIS|nr:hypothetical protein [Kingella bonacorsii]MBK0395089.1 hypothetical protein [Kingella bonacorsii]
MLKSRPSYPCYVFRLPQCSGSPKYFQAAVIAKSPHGRAFALRAKRQPA